MDDTPSSDVGDGLEAVDRAGDTGEWGPSVTAPGALFDLRGKVALITGGSRGLGREIVLAMSNAGADIVIASRTGESGRALGERVEAESGRAPLVLTFDVGYWDEVDGVVDAAYERFGKVDILVNGASYSPSYDRLGDMGEDTWDRVFDVNLKGPFRLTARVGARMVEAGGGSIINITSVAAIRPRPGEGAYAAAKAGLNVLTEVFAKDLGPNVRVNAIQAGPFYTDASKDWNLADFAQRARDSIALERGGEPSEVVGAAMYFASEASSFCTGAILRLDGGVG